MLTTRCPDLTLLQLQRVPARELYDLVQQNKAHLTAHGDYHDQVCATLGDVENELDDGPGSKFRFGIFFGERLVGRADLVPVHPQRYGLGYWLSASETGKGYATAALEALIGFARDAIRASDIYAGVSHGNAPSVALLERTGFQPVAEFETHIRFRRTL